jgi:hypothetical protein
METRKIIIGIVVAIIILVVVIAVIFVVIGLGSYLWRKFHPETTNAEQITSDTAQDISGDVENPVSTEVSGKKMANYVRLEIPGKDKVVNLGEMEVFSNGVNIALNKKADMSSQYSKYPTLSADRAVDGRTSGNALTRSDIAHSLTQENPWWEVDLGGPYPIDKIIVTNRDESQYWSRMDNSDLVLLDKDRNIVEKVQLLKPQFQTIVDF